MTREQFEVVYGSFQLVLQALLARGINYADATDDTQTAFSKAWEHRNQLKNESKALAWIRRIAVNEAIDRYRRNRHLTEMPAGFEPRIEPSVDLQGLDFQIALSRVSGAHRDTLKAMLEGRTASDLAAAGTSLNSIYQRMTRARRALHKAMHAA